MATEKQIAANQRNAKKSTGPKSEETKAIVRLNAMRDGFNGQVITLSDDDRPVFEKFKTNFITDLAPKTTIELSLAHSLAWDTWRLNHLRAVEMNMYALGTTDPATAFDCDDPRLATAMSDTMTFAKESKKLALMSIYEQRINRAIHKNLATLRDLQAERKQNYEKDIRQEVILAEACDINSVPYAPPVLPSRNGFVFSTAEILAASNRVNGLYEANTTVGREPVKVRFASATSGAPLNVVNWPEPEAA